MLMCTTRKMALIGATLLALVAMPAAADEVVLKNGDRITGTLVELAGGKLSIKTEYAGTIEIEWGKVQTFSTDGPVYLTIGENVVLATVLPGEDGMAELESDESLTGEPVELSRLESMSYEKKPAVRVTGRINIGASSTSGNTNQDTLNGSFQVVARSKKNRVTLGAEANRAETDGTQTESNWLAFLGYDHFISKQWYAYASTSAENDKFKDINLRTTLGAGGGYQFFENDQTNLSMELGLSYVNTDFETGMDSDYPAARWAMNFSQMLFKSRVEFFNVDSVHTALDDSDNFFLRTRTGLRFPIVDRLNSTIQYNYDYDDNPAPGRVKADKAWLFTLGYTW
jgi:putative salt-induced outer membrane protein YdiY